MASGDVTSQFLLSPEGHSFVWKRTAHIFCFGFCVSAPVYHNWYRLVETQIPGKSVLQVIKKVLADQTLMAPLVITTLFFSIGWRQGKSFDQTWKVGSGGHVVVVVVGGVWEGSDVVLILSKKLDKMTFEEMAS
eukprot:TRINITY_DN2124_c0_g1_i4.p1 TRINITY_DN2124_c0_g1~~TRINITY_DN2124_c0_g1_i4.p1  ORF type:complete len:134 (-),score=27.68 TRINITY_DN2124_c0_g1_i4:327-728(-)